VSKSSAFVLALWNEDGEILYDVVFRKNIGKGFVVLHMNGDRNCGRSLSGYHSVISKNLGVPDTYDMSFLDAL
jgi:hypothetical protein